MRRIFPFFNQQLARLGIAGLVVGVILGVFLAAVFASAFPEWVGFAADPLPPGATATPVVIYNQSKTLWDWLQLLLVPLVLAGGGYWLTREENRYALKMQERREQEARRSEDQRSQDTALQAYLDKMTDLLLEGGLREFRVEAIMGAKARTLSLLRLLDGGRKASVVEFLYTSLLITCKYDPHDPMAEKGLPVLDLAGADLSGVDLSEMYLSGVSFRNADLSGANFTRTMLMGADLRGAILNNATLCKATVRGVDLEGASLRGANLRWASLFAPNRLGVADIEGADLSGVLIEVPLEGDGTQGAIFSYEAPPETVKGLFLGRSFAGKQQRDELLETLLQRAA